MVDVVASSKDGKPITDLKAEDFTPLEENGKKQNNEMTYVNMRVNDPTAPAPLPTEQTYGAYSQQTLQQSTQHVRRTSALLSDAQIAMYPVDARGRLGADASQKGTTASGLLMEGQEFGESIAAASNQVDSSQTSMRDLAEQTGGRVFLNRNDIDNRVALAAGDGAAYYSLGYYPDKRKVDGSLCKISVSVARPGVQLHCRPGYFAMDPGKINKKDMEADLLNTLRENSDPATMVVFDVPGGAASGGRDGKGAHPVSGQAGHHHSGRAEGRAEGNQPGLLRDGLLRSGKEVANIGDSGQFDYYSRVIRTSDAAAANDAVGALAAAWRI
jgi:hypothetical protein